ncbi:hypothetical protein RGU76_30300 [Bacillus pseudomycoides]|uniref:hypothetical protein n=1 Tax=Bacillus sp. DHT2 TaxID=2994532 RepID=UPI002248D7DC|nr:hypothetical protein [Bacillus sp. DHT2]MDR4919086.1 hypothetical protein [Bacillus pseudomycoides]
MIEMNIVDIPKNKRLKNKEKTSKTTTLLIHIFFLEILFINIYGEKLKISFFKTSLKIKELDKWNTNQQIGKIKILLSNCSFDIPLKKYNIISSEDNLSN